MSTTTTSEAGGSLRTSHEGPRGRLLGKRNNKKTYHDDKRTMMGTMPDPQTALIGQRTAIAMQALSDQMSEMRTLVARAGRFKSITPSTVLRYLPQDRISAREALGTVRQVVTLRTRGCSWARRSHGGCRHCGLPYASDFADKVSESPIEQFRRLVPMDSDGSVSTLCIYCGGSFLCLQELTEDEQRGILNEVAQRPWIRHLVIEARPEFIEERLVQMVREILPDIEVEVGVGLDSWTPDVRNLVLNRGGSPIALRRAFEILRSADITIQAYVLLKPPFLTEREAIEETVLTTTTAFDLGADVVSIEAVAVAEYTITHILHNAGLYRPPWLWSVVQLIERLDRWRDKIRVSYQYEPQPITFASNCPKCTSYQHSFIYRAELPTLGELQGLQCNCKADWLEEMERKDDSSILDRVLRALNDSRYDGAREQIYRSLRGARELPLVRAAVI